MSAGYQEGTPRWSPEDRQGKTAKESIDEQWEERRQELVALGTIFDAKGNITQAGRDFLMRESKWGIEQVLQMEVSQKNHAAPVEVIRPGKDEGVSEGRMSSVERGKMSADARARAEQALVERARRDAESA